MDDSTPYAFVAWTYRAAGYTGVIPIGRGPAQKSPPPTGYTGWAGVDPSGADVQAWADGREGARNIGWHVPAGHLVIDVDAYHRGAESLAKLEDKIGTPLPPTWSSTARGADSASRHRMYRAVLPAGRTWRDHPGDGIDSLHVGHRYAMVWPSVHPDGGVVTWYDPDGEPYEGAPEPSWFAVLGEAWIDELSQPGVPLEGAGATDEATMDALKRFRLAPPCTRVERQLAKELDRITRARDGVGSLHDPGALYPLVAYGLEGHAGVREALSAHQAAYVRARVDSRGDTEGVSDQDWWRQVRGAVGKKLHASGGVILTGCDCAPEEVPGEPSRLDLLKAKLLNRDALDRVPPVQPLIRGVLDMDSESWIIGPPGGFKSFVALDWACHVATGRDWRGQKTTPGDVLYLVAEGSKGIPNRVRAWEATYEDRADRLYILPEPVQVANATAWDTFVELGAEMRPALIVLDTQARITAGLDENSAGAMSTLTEAVRRLKQASGACVLVVHHTGRNGQDARGSSAIDGAQDMEWRVDRPPRRLTATLSIDKSKDGSDEDRHEITMQIVAVGVDEETGAALTSLAVRPWDPFEVPYRPEPAWKTTLEGNQREVMLVMTDHSAEVGLTVPDIARFIGERRRERDIEGTMPRSSLHTALKVVTEAGLLARLGTSRYVLPEFLDEE